jgi:hypothetical protein
MAPQEVAGLQALAKAHGGSLTINPDTGLPEAGFLSSILPMLAGAALTATGIGAPLAAAMVGGGYGLATGSLKKGLMAGLGAYGGAGLAGSIMGTGTAAAQQAAMAGVDSLAGTGVGSAQGINAMDALSDAATQSLSPSAAAATPSYNVMTGGFSTDPGLGLVPTPPAATPVPPTLAAQAVPTTTQAPALTQQGLLNEAAARVTPGTELFKQAGGSYMDTAKTGLGAIMDKPELLFNKDNLKYGLAAAAPLLFQEQEQKARKEEKPYEYEFNYGRVDDPNAGYTGPYTGERTYFNPVFTRKAAGGGLMDIGPLEAMSNRNQAETIMSNGGQMFAEGGETSAVSKVEDNPFYTMTGQSGDAFKYLMGQGPKTAPAAAPAALLEPVKFVAGSADLAKETGDLDNSYVFNPSTGAFTSIGETVKNTSPAAAAQYYSGGDSPGRVGVTDKQAAVFDFMNTPAGQSYKDAYGAANSKAIGSFMPGSIFTGALKGEFTDPFSALREASSVYSAAEQAARDSRIGNLPTGYEGVGGPGTYSGSVSDPSQSYGGGDTTSASSADSTASDNSGVGGWAYGGLMALAGGGQSHLGDYSDGGRLLRGPGDGVSDSIPASIGDKRPARLADGEFVVPARIVSELGNGSTEAGARKLYAMMDRVQKARGKTVGKDRVAVNSKAEKMLPA